MRVSVALFVLSLVGAVGGAWLVGRWAVGVVVVVYSAALGLFALLRDVPQQAAPDTYGTLQAVLDRARRAA